MNTLFGGPRRRTAVLAGLLAGFALAVAISLAGPRAQAEPGVSDRFWSRLYLNAVSQNFESVLDMMKSSDVVVIGRLGPMEASRSWVAAPELGADGIAFYAKSAVKVERVVHGEFAPSAPDTLDLELFIPVPGEFEAFKSSQPSERTMLFLFRKDEIDSPVYGIVSINRGYIRDFGSAEPPVGADDGWLLSVRDVPFDDLARRLAEADGEP